MEKSTIIRTAVLALALVNQILAAAGKSPIPVSDAELEQLISTAITVGAAAWAWWKNNSFTENAIKADEFLKRLKGM